MKTIDLLLVKHVLLRLDGKVCLDASYWIRFAPFGKIVDTTNESINSCVRDEFASWRLVLQPMSPCLVNN